MEIMRDYGYIARRELAGDHDGTYGEANPLWSWLFSWTHLAPLPWPLSLSIVCGGKLRSGHTWEPSVLHEE